VSKWDFELMTQQDAERILVEPDHSAESWHDNVRAVRRLMPVTTEEERRAAREFNRENAEMRKSQDLRNEAQ